MTVSARQKQYYDYNSGEKIEVAGQTYWNQFPKPFGRRLQRKQQKQRESKR